MYDVPISFLCSHSREPHWSRDLEKQGHFNLSTKSDRTRSTKTSDKEREYINAPSSKIEAAFEMTKTTRPEPIITQEKGKNSQPTATVRQLKRAGKQDLMTTTIQATTAELPPSGAEALLLDR